MDTGKWMAVSQAQQALEKSERTIRRWIDSGKLQSRQGSNGVEVLVEDAATKTGAGQATPDALQVEIDRLRTELEERDRHISELQADKRHLQERGERLEQLLAMEKQQNKQLIDYQLQPFWKRWFKQKALPAPGEVMDMESSTDKES